MTAIWDPREVFDIYPEEAGFTCSGITQRGARCRQSFIARADKQLASELLDTLHEQDGFFTNHRALYPSLKQLAELTLCPRWHRHGRLSQIDTVASKWLRAIQSLNTARSTRRSAHQPRASSRNNYVTEPTPTRALLPPPARSIHSRSTSSATVSSRQSSNGSQTLSALPTPPRTPTRSHASLSDRSATTTPAHNPSTTQITVSVTVSSSNSQGTTSTTLVHQLPSDSPPSNTTISISTVTPQTVVNISTNPQNNHAIEPTPETSPSIHARRNLGSTPRASSPALNSTTLETSSGGELSRIVSPAPWLSRISSLFLSPPLSPLPSHPAGTLSISTESGRDTPASSDAISDYSLSPPATPTLSSTQTSRLPSPPSTPLRRDPAPSVTSVARQRPTRVARRSISDPCFVCLLDIETPTDAVWCQESCGQNVHEECFNIWRETCNDLGSPVKCMFCRAPWVS